MGKYDADPELIARLEAQCAAQGIPVKVSDPATLRYIANIVTSAQRERLARERAEKAAAKLKEEPD